MKYIRVAEALLSLATAIMRVSAGIAGVAMIVYASLGHMISDMPADSVVVKVVVGIGLLMLEDNLKKGE